MPPRLLTCAAVVTALLVAQAVPTQDDGPGTRSAAAAPRRGGAGAGAPGRTPDAVGAAQHAAGAAVGRSASIVASSGSGGTWVAGLAALVAGRAAGALAGQPATVFRTTGQAGALASAVADTSAAGAPTLVTTWFRGSGADAGRQVVLEVSDTATGQHRSSAPLTLEPWWQTAGVPVTPMTTKL